MRSRQRASSTESESGSERVTRAIPSTEGVEFQHGPLDQPEGIGVYAREIAARTEEKGGQACEARVPEVEIAGRRFGGYVGRIARHVFASSGADLVHAANLFQLTRDTDVLTVHDLEVVHHQRDEYGPLGWFWERALRKADGLEAIVVPSHHIRRRVEASDVIEAERTEVVHHGIDHGTFFPPDVNEPEALRNRAANLVRGDASVWPRPWILLVGAYRPRKRFVRALERVDEVPGTVIHAGPVAEFPEARDRIEEAVGEAGGAFVELGYIDRDELRVIYQAADVLLHPARNEGFGFCPVEAAACGTPSVLADVPVWDETLPDLYARFREDLGTAIEEARQVRAKRLVRRARDFTWGEAFEEHAALWADLRGLGGSA